MTDRQRHRQRETEIETERQTEAEKVFHTLCIAMTGLYFGSIKLEFDAFMWTFTGGLTVDGHKVTCRHSIFCEYATTLHEDRESQPA